MHDFFWLTLNWPWPVFVILLAIAIAIWVFTTRAGFFGLSIWGALAVSFVLYFGVVWELWSWVPGVFKFFWIVGLLAALLCLVWYHRLVETVAAVGTGVALFIVAVLVFWQALFVPAWNALGLPHIETGDVSHVSETTAPPVITNPPTDTTPDGSSEPPTSSSTSGAFECSQVSWPVTTGFPVLAPKVVRQSIHSATTSREAFQAIKLGWYNWAMDHPSIYRQLALAVKAATPTLSDMEQDGQATAELSCLAENVGHLMDGAVYTPEHTDILVRLPDGTEFRVMASTGQVH